MNNMKKEQLRLYAVTDRTWLGNETLYEQVEKALEGGATLVQLREKELPEADVQKANYTICREQMQFPSQVRRIRSCSWIRRALDFLPTRI